MKIQADNLNSITHETETDHHSLVYRVVQ